MIRAWGGTNTASTLIPTVQQRSRQHGNGSTGTNSSSNGSRNRGTYGSKPSSTGCRSLQQAVQSRYLLRPGSGCTGVHMQRRKFSYSLTHSGYLGTCLCCTLFCAFTVLYLGFMMSSKTQKQEYPTWYYRYVCYSTRHKKKQNRHDDLCNDSRDRGSGNFSSDKAFPRRLWVRFSTMQ